MKKLLTVLISMLFLPLVGRAQVTVIQSPTPQFRSSLPSGAPNVGGCVYTFASGTSTPQATYTDNTGLTPNVNPTILDSTGSANVWITGQTYRFQVWSFGSGTIGSNCGNGTQLYQIDGVRDTGLNALNGPITIAPTSNGIDIFDLIRATDISPTGNFVNFKSLAGSTLFKVDINGNVTSGTVNGATITSGGINGAGITNGSLTLTEVAAPACPSGFDVIWADSTAHRPKTCGNGGSAAQLVISLPGNDINSTDQVAAWHFGATQTPLSGTAPTTGQLLEWDGAHIVGVTAATAIAANQTAQAANIGATTLTTPSANGFYRFSCYIVLTQAATTSSVMPGCQVGFTDADSGVAETMGILASGNNANLAGSLSSELVVSSLFNPHGFFAKSGVAITYATTGYSSTGATPMQYAIHVRLEGPF